MGAKYRDLVRLHSKARSSARAVLNVLANYANDEGIAWPSRATIANDTGMSERNVIRCLQALCDQGRLELRENGVGGRGRIPHYRILFPEMSDPQPINDPVKGDKLTEERVTNSSEKGDISALKGDKSVVKGDKCVENPSYARNEPTEPTEEPYLEPAQSCPSPRVPQVVQTSYGSKAIDFGNGFPGRNRDKGAIDELAKQYKAFGLTPKDFTALVNAILDGKKTRKIADLDTRQGRQELADAQECALALLTEGRNTPQDVTTLFETFAQYDFRGQKGQLPSYKALAEHPAQLPGLIEASRKNGAINGSNRQNSTARSGQPDGGDTPQLDPDIQRRMDEHRAKRKAEGSRYYQ